MNKTVFAMDPGKTNTWWCVFNGTKYINSGNLDIPKDIMDYYKDPFLNKVKELLVSQGITLGTDVVLERFQYRPGFGANSIEHVNQLISIVFMTATQLGASCYMYQAADHKTAYKKFHTDKFPVAMIEKVGFKHGTWRPILKRTDPCPHVMDSMTLACYHILRQNNKI